ncbi:MULTISPECIES: hypothetical protein [unclassified Nonomuraea]|uniref:hypothetical protein n=1 Tax=unclassified Nonomuraea TaxID=2593643 RepID=UPI003400B11C
MNTRAAFVAAPLLVLSYGVIRIVDGFDGSRGPGPAWTTGHLAFLAALALFIVIFRDMWRMLGRGRIATTSLVVGLVGIACAAAQFVIDIVVGFMAADHAAMTVLWEQIQAVPGVSPVVYSVGPALFHLAQLALVIHLAVRRQVRPWMPVLVLLDVVVPLVSLDLMPVGAVLMLVAFWPPARRQAQAGARHTLVHA